MNDGRKILMLGGSSQQVPAIKKARELGFYTVLCDYLPDNPGRLVADRFYPVSTTDIAEVSKIARNEAVEGILAYASDPAALTAAVVASELNLPSNPVKAVEVLGEKHRFRHFLKENRFNVPKVEILPQDISLDEALKKISSIPFPAVIKPTDSSGSKGITFIKEIPDTAVLKNAMEYARSFSRNNVIIAEEYIEREYPYIIGGDIFVENGKIVIYGIMDCLRDKEHGGLIPVGKMFPSSLSPVQQEVVKATLSRLVKTLGVHSGELNVELILGKGNRPYMLELGPRAGGNMIPVQLSDIFGVDLIGANVLAAMGVATNLHPVVSKDCYMTHVLHSYTDGIFHELAFSDEISKYIYRKEIYKKPGTSVESFDGAGKALGIIFLKFPDIDTMHRMAENIQKHIKII